MPDLERKQDPLQPEREARLRRLGELSPQVISRMAPFRMTNVRPRAAPWPADALGTLRIVQRPDRTLLVTDGLSSPWNRDLHPDAPAWTFGFELALEGHPPSSPELRGEAVARSWMPGVLWAVTDWLLEGRHRLKQRLGHGGCATVPIPPLPGLEPLACATGFIGGMVGIPLLDPALGSPLALAGADADAVWLVTLKLLTPDEYEWVLADPGDVRTRQLAEAFLRRGDGPLSLPERPSVLPHVVPEHSAAAPKRR